MAIPVILKGDTAATISLQLAEGYDYDGCWLDIELLDIKTTMALPSAGSVIELTFSAAETARFPLGTSKIFFAVRNERGDRKSLPWAKIKVVDAPAAIASPVIVLDPATIADIDTTEADSLGDVKRKLNKLLTILRAGAICLAAAFVSAAAYSAELQPTTQLNDVPGNATISNIVAAAGVSLGAGGTDGNAVTNIAIGLLHHKVFPEVDRKRDIDELGYGKPVIEPDADFIVTIEGEEPVRVPWNPGWMCYQLYGEKMINIQITQTGKFYMLAFWVVGENDAVFTDAMVREYPITEFVFGNGKYRGKLDKKYPDRLALKSEVLSKEEVKETIREVNGGVWDQKLEVWWTPKMENGKLTYQATTNINLKVEK